MKNNIAFIFITFFWIAKKLHILNKIKNGTSGLQGKNIAICGAGKSISKAIFRLQAEEEGQLTGNRWKERSWFYRYFDSG